MPNENRPANPGAAQTDITGLGHFDVIIVGAGATGAVMALRLTENPACRVLLLEAGPAQGSAAMQAATRNGNQPAVLPGLNWKIRTFIKSPPAAAKPAPGSTGPTTSPVRGVASIFDYEAGKVLGGSSSVNAVQALRGTPADFDEWASECGGQWGWDGVLPFFRKLENDPAAEAAPALHGSDGPMPIRRESGAAITPLQQGLYQACLAKGYPATDDHNDPATTGVGVIPKNVVDGVRMSSAQTYLPLARERANFQVLTDVMVHRLHWRSATACGGVEAEINGTVHTLLADKVIVCAGVMQTPGLLMRSGIGAPKLLKPLGIEVRSPLSGVGENFMEHPVVGIWGIPKAGSCTLGEPLRQVLLRYTSGHSGHQNDMHICMMAGINVGEMFPNLAASSSATTLAGLTTCFNKSVSRGYVRIDCADPHAKPLVVNNCLGVASDIAPLKHGVRLAWDLMQSTALAPQFDQILAWTSGMIQSEVALERAVTTFVRPAAHGCGSARMGLLPDAGAVLDPQGRVWGVENLWVADASAIPVIPSCPPHLTAVMVAEKLADIFCKEHH